jgi:hypothetical protein
MSKQICPKCKSSNICIAQDFSNLGNPLLSESLTGWECLNCGYIGKDFFIVTEKKLKSKNSTSKNSTSKNSTSKKSKPKKSKPKKSKPKKSSSKTLKSKKPISNKSKSKTLKLKT